MQVSVYFITGATGVVGNEIAANLLTRDARLRLLVRADSDDQAEQRLGKLVEYWQIDPQIAKDQIEVLRGDATQPRFGLSEERYSKIAGTTTHIVHCAAMVRMNLPLEEARQSAVSAARNILELAGACQSRGILEKVDALSTVGVAGRSNGMLAEQWVTEPRQFHNTYEQAKAEAEDLLASACEAGLPITVHRPSMVVGNSRTGRIIRFQIFYYLVEFLSGRRTRGLYPSLGEARLDLIPVDIVAQVVCHSSRSGGTVGRVLHLCSGPRHAMPIGQLKEIVREKLRALGEPVPIAVTVPTALLRAALPIVRMLVPARQKAALDVLPVFLDYLSGTQDFDNAATTTLLQNAGIRIPSPDAYVSEVLSYYFENRRTHV
jgi:thioester reductase-like protein